MTTGGKGTAVPRAIGLAVAVLLLISGVAIVSGHQAPKARRPVVVAAPPPAHLDIEGVTSTTDSTTTTEPTTTTAAPPTTAAPTTTTAPRRSTTTAPRLQIAGTTVSGATVPAALTAYRGLATWSDVFDWSPSHTNGNPPTHAADVDAMAQAGVQTLFIQAARAEDPTDVTDADTLQPIIDRAAARGISVVAWYLPTLTDPAKDLQKLVAIAHLRHVSSIGVDIESRAVSDVNERNARLVNLSQALRQQLPSEAISAIVLPPVVLEVVNTNYWPSFPWRQIAPFYDVWMPMGYWTNRTQSSGYRDAYRYTAENVTRLRNDVGRSDLLVSAIGGIGDQTTAADIDGFRRAVTETGVIGGGLYDWRTTAASLWPALAPLRR